MLNQFTNKEQIPLLKPNIFKDSFIENHENDMLSSERINAFFIHSFKDDIVNLKLPLPLHKKTVHDFVLILDGSMTKSIGVHSFHLKRNQFLFTPSNAITTTSETSQKLDGFYCHFSHNFLKQNPYLRVWITQATSLNLLTLTDTQIANLKTLLNRISSLYQTSFQKKSNYTLIPYYLSAFIAEVSIIAQETPSITKENPLVTKFNHMVNKRFKESKKVHFYADLLHVSPNHLNKVIRTETGKSASDIIYKICVLEAKVLLGQTTLNINEIAIELGFEDASYFSRFFKKHAGISPTEYRKMIDLS